MKSGGSGGDPGNVPSHAVPVGLQLLERRLRDEYERHVTSVKMREHGLDGVGDRRVHGVAGLVTRSEHEVVDEQLGSPLEQLGERLLAFLGIEPVPFAYGHPRQVATFLGELVAEPGVLLLANEQLLACFVPLFPRRDPVSHRSSS